MARKRGTKWQADAKLPDGRRVRPTFSTLEEAEAFEKNPVENHVKPLVGEVFRRGYMLMWQREKDHRDAIGITEELIRRLGPERQVSTITQPVVNQLILDLLQEGNSQPRINRKLAKLSKLLNFAQELGYLKEKPRLKRFKDGEGRTRFLTKDEAKTLLSYLDGDYQAFATFLLYVGSRYGETKALRWEDIQGDKVTFRWTTTKGGKSRTLPLPKPALDALRAVQDRPAPWSNIEYDEWHRRFTTAKLKAQLDDPEIVPHTLRHTCASWLVESGVDLLRVQKWMGHASYSTTLGYARLRTDALDGIAAVLQ